MDAHTPKAVNEGRYVPLAQPSSPTIGNNELHYHSSDTDSESFKRRVEAVMKTFVEEEELGILAKIKLPKDGPRNKDKVADLLKKIIEAESEAEDFLKLLAKLLAKFSKDGPQNKRQSFPEASSNP